MYLTLGDGQDRHKDMEIYNGDLLDTTNMDSSSFLQINSCGIQLPSQRQLITYRKKGRVDYHVLYIAAGRCKIEYEGITHLIRQGFVLYPPNVSQMYIEYEGTRKIWLHFTGYQVEEILREACLPYGVHATSHSPLIEKMFVQLVTEHSQKMAISNEKGLLLSILYTLGKLVNHANTTNDKINETITFITTHYNTKISIQELAASCSLSQSRFMYLFKKQTGMAPHAYQQALRIQNCMTLLTSTQLRISDICELSGYQDPLYFSRIFKKMTGMAPSQYRNQRMAP